MPRWVQSWVTGAALLITAVLAILAFNVPGDMAKNPYAKAVGLFWALGPPAWFFLEWYFYKGPLTGCGKSRDLRVSERLFGS